VACALYWPHPGVWMVARRLRIERELACDDRVLTAGTQPRDYAGHLLEIAYSLGGGRAPALAVTMARPRQLEGRMLAVLDESEVMAAAADNGPHLSDHALVWQGNAAYSDAGKSLYDQHNIERAKSLLKEGGARMPDFAPDDMEKAREIVRLRQISCYHVSGSCAMLPKELGGVVNERLVVYGTANIRVVDASIFPLEPLGNIQTTVYAVAEKAADMIKEDRK